MELETINHVFFRCPFYRELCAKIIEHLTREMNVEDEEKLIGMLLMGDNTPTTFQVAKFCAILIKIRQLNTASD